MRKSFTIFDKTRKTHDKIHNDNTKYKKMIKIVSRKFHKAKEKSAAGHSLAHVPGREFFIRQNAANKARVLMPGMPQRASAMARVESRHSSGFSAMPSARPEREAAKDEGAAEEHGRSDPVKVRASRLVIGP